MDSGPRPVFRRILLKLSGEALAGPKPFGIDFTTIESICTQIREVKNLGTEIAVVVGGGNIFRGLEVSKHGMDRVTADNMGMLATVINALSLQDNLERLGVFTRVMSALRVESVAEPYIRRRAIRHMEKGRVVILAAGTGNPFFTTDTAAALRGSEVGAEIVLKATKVDGVYSADPRKDPDATRYSTITFDEALARNLQIMDATAFALCRAQRLPIKVFNITKPGALKRVVMGEDEGTLVHV